MAKGQSTAHSFQLQVEAMGQENFTRLKVTEQIASGKVKIIPELLITGAEGSDGGVNGLMGLQLLKMLEDKAVAAK
jgi:hypothetical protein